MALIRQLTGATELATYKRHKCIQQKYICPICSGTLAAGITALDHCHTNGQIRSVLCLTCNRSEGKVRLAMRYMAKKTHLVWRDEVKFLRRLANYLEHHNNNPSGVYHPTYDLRKGKQKPKPRKTKRRGKK